MLLRILILLALLGPATGLRAELRVGSTKAEVLDMLGEPELEVTRRGRQVLTYAGKEIELAHGVVVTLEADPEEIARRLKQGSSRTTATPRRSIAAAPPRAGVKSGGEPVHIVLPTKGSSNPVETISNGGQAISLNALLAPGKVTIVDFYADWCGPCRKTSPLLEAMARSDPDVVLRKVDIVKWKTPVAKQYALRSIPNIRVFDRNGKMVGSPTPDVNRVRAFVKQAK